jgi:hypothetical protein
VRTASAPAWHVVVGPERHGVVTHARHLAEAYQPLLAVTRRVESADALAAFDPHGRPVLLPVTDRLLGATPEAAAEAVERASRTAPLVLALHDVPQPEEGADWFRRRREAYRRFVGAATRVVVASHSERRMLAGLLDPDEAARLDRVARVVPLPIERVWTARPVASADEVAVLGFLYPGKGVEDVVDAVAARPGLPRVVTNYGAAAAGHEDHVATLVRYAADRGVEFRVTGYLDEDLLYRTLATAGIPVAPHRHVSASASVGTWVAAGRRPVVRDVGWFRELAARLPGTVTVATSLPDALVAAAADPASTWLADDVEVGPPWRAAARAHVAVLEELT